MQRIAILNFIIGFALLFVSALAGVFLAYSANEAYALNVSALHNSWQELLLRSAHGHTNLFGMIHILYGLTQSYSHQSIWIKKAQTLGLSLGSFAMSILLWLKSYQAPSISVTIMSALIGSFLCAFMFALLSHIYGLLLKYLRVAR